MGAAAAVLVLAAGGCAGPVDLAPVHPQGRSAAVCRALVGRLPDRVGGQQRREVAAADRRYAAAWGSPPITLRCGVGRPAAYTRTSQLFVVDHVDWLPVPQDAVHPTRFYAVGRRAYVELVVPKEQGRFSDAMVDLTRAVRANPKVR